MVLDHSEWRRSLEAELHGNLLPFWIAHTVDETHGGFYGALTNDLQILNDEPRSAVLYARILWTYAAAYRRYPEERSLIMARRAYDYLFSCFRDLEYGGVYWQVDRTGRALEDRKHVYAQAFAIYGLSEYYRATGEPGSLKLARDLFHLIDAFSYDSLHGGNIEALNRTWGALADMRLSLKEPLCRKSMNTLLHLMEAYTNLLRIWDDEHLKARQRDLIEIFLERIIDPRTHHFHLFFNDDWTTLPDVVSYGHDIEGSWLLVEAAEVLGDPMLFARARVAAQEMAEAVFREGLDPDGSLRYESGTHPAATDKHWWAQAEAMVGFYNAYQLSGRPDFARASARVWDYIQEKMVDRKHGEWFKVLNQAGQPYLDHVKTGPWECPYHHSRACFEMLDRLSK